MLIVLAKGQGRRGIGGLLVGFGATWIILFARAQLDCFVSDLMPGSQCVMAGMEPWYFTAAVVLGLGLVVLRLATGSGERDRDPLSERGGDGDEQR